MKSYGDLDLQENEVRGMVIQLEPEIPSTSKQGRLLFRNKKLYVASEITGVPVWIPLTTEISTHIHNQGSGSTSWSIAHNLDTTTPNVTIWDSSNNVIIPDEITVVDANNVTVTFASNQTGRAIVLHGFDGTAF